MPNAITIARLALLPWFGWAVWRGERQTAVVLLAVIAGSDVLDGWLARRWQVSSPLGAFLDPLADKLAQITGLALLATTTEAAFAPIVPWFVALVVARELWLAYGTLRVRFRRKRVRIEARVLGKLSTLLVFVLLFASLTGQPAVVRLVTWLTAPVVLAAAAQYTLAGREQYGAS